ncbi:MAG: hypothetical protein QOH26_2030 [Actinomycetota bacterium]|jgi:hypothetical protein|nr:hypothetical protein [Actinomycetota bacterium]
MTDKKGESLETQAEEASKDANVTIDEPTAPALDTEPDPSTEWEKAGDGSRTADSSDDTDDDSGQS